MEQFFYLHIWSITNAHHKDDHLTVEIDYWPADDLFSCSPYFFCTERLRSILQHAAFSGLLFEKVQRIDKGANFIDNFPDAELPPFYWQIISENKPGADDFSIWDNKYLIVSDRALRCLRKNHVTHAEADLIDIPFDDYFNSSRKYFWMPENVKNKFIQMDQAKKDKI